uniref:non-specific serine/threonine protein kinase n=1 Tax=Elaeophora elaphi TaxID=1147741 RepID=A0A0R3RTV6_9BILA
MVSTGNCKSAIRVTKRWYKDCSAIDTSKAESEKSSGSEGSDDGASEEEIVLRQRKNSKDAIGNIDDLNANLMSGDSICSYPGILTIEEDNSTVGKDLQSASRNMEPLMFAFDEENSGSNNVGKESEKWALTPRISADFSCECLLCFPYFFSMLWKIYTEGFLSFYLDDDDDKICTPKRKKSRERITKFQMGIFFASVIEMLCDGEFEGLNVHFREVLRKVAGHFIHSSYLSEDYKTFRIAIRRRITKALNTATNLKIENGLTINTPEKRNYFLSSRYSVDFKEIRKIGRGGFGEVFHVHSNIDNCDYAVKKIQFNLTVSKLVTKIVNEVRLLAAVQHMNIVRYYAAWLELQDVQDGKGNARQQFGAVSLKLGRFWRQDSSTTSSLTISEEGKMCPNVSASQSLAITRGSTRTDPINLMLPQSGTAVMFVQMELCSRTLSDYFAERNAGTFLRFHFLWVIVNASTVVLKCL